MSQERVVFLDVLKAFAIFLVVWGHSMAFLTCDNSYWVDDVCEQVIYSFHMPLFMMISGYFSISLLRMSFWQMVKKQFVRLIIPSVVWHVSVGLVLFFATTLVTSAVDWNKLWEIGLSSFTVFWFLKALFVVQIFCWLAQYLVRKRCLGVVKGGIVLIVSVLFVVYFKSSILNYVSWFAMVPFFVLGLAVNKYAYWIAKYESTLLWVCLGLFLILVCCWPHDTFDIYFNSMEWSVDAIVVFLKRTLIGTFGSLGFFIAFKKIFSNTQKKYPKIELIGTMTLGIYIIQRYLVERMAIHSGPYMDNLLAGISPVLRIMLYDGVITPVFSLGVLAISYWMIIEIRKHKHLKTLLLGEV